MSLLHDAPAGPAAAPASSRDEGFDASVMLRIAFAVAPIPFGLDKFANVLTEWPGYLAGRRT